METKTNNSVPVVIGALSLACQEDVKKMSRSNISKIPGNIRITELQKIVLLGTAHILRRSLSFK